METERKLLDVRNEAVECQYMEMKEVYKTYRCSIHDEKHRMFYLNECLAEGNVQGAIDFLHNYCENTVNEKPVSWTGIPTLDFMINIKKEKLTTLRCNFILFQSLKIFQ